MLPGIKVEDTDRGKELIEKMQGLEDSELKSILQGITNITPESKKKLTDRINYLKTLPINSIKEHSKQGDSWRYPGSFAIGVGAMEKQRQETVKELIRYFQQQVLNSAFLENLLYHTLYLTELTMLI